ncbi:MAG: tetratricopeptide repeat protein 38 family protein [Marinosulfonomonas sp.]|nr:MAG: tetratricopeptide repeat protein 38 family protein [Marinosulfonomonas sp.]
MLRERYGNDLSTESTTARDHYITGVDRILGAEPDIVAAFEAAVAADPGFALGHVGLARARQMAADVPGARKDIAQARSLTGGISRQEASHIDAMGLLIDGKIKLAYPAIRAHVDQYPRDVMVAQTCTGIFGLIGTSGLAGRESEQLAYTTTLVPHYGDDWWFLGQHAFALCETGQVERASAMVDRSLELNPRNANAAHIRSHAYYEAGDTKAGIGYLKEWLPDYHRSSMLYGHLAWHIALWELEQGNIDAMWKYVDADVRPGTSLGLPLNVLTDGASILYRAELAGEDVPTERWREISDYAKQFFPNPGFGFADVHAALAHAMCGDTESLEKIIANPAGPTADLVREYSCAYRAIAAENWAKATAHLMASMGDHARISGSRAQRDLLVHTLLGTLLKQGCDEEARHLLAMQRPVQAGTRPVVGL